MLTVPLTPDKNNRVVLNQTICSIANVDLNQGSILHLYYNPDKQIVIIRKEDCSLEMAKSKENYIYYERQVDSKRRISLPACLKEASSYWLKYDGKELIIDIFNPIEKA